LGGAEAPPPRSTGAEAPPPGSTGAAAPPVGVTGAAHIAVGVRRPAVLVPAGALRAAVGDEAEVVVCGDDGHAHVVRVRRGTSVDVTAPGASPSAPAADVARAGRAPSTRLVEVQAPALNGNGDVDGGAASVRAGTMVAVEPVLGIADGDPLERVR
jgi:hypothetical protein